VVFEDKSWRELVEREELIDVEEWAAVRGEPAPFTLPTGFTRALWDALVEGRATACQSDDCIAEVIVAAKRALGRLARRPTHDGGTFVLRFAAPFPARRGRDGWCPLQMVGGSSPDGERRLVIGLVDERLAADLPERPPGAPPRRR